MRFFKFIFSRIFICFVVIAALIAAIIFLCVYIGSLLPAAAALAFSLALSATASLALILKDSPAEFKCAWLAVIATLPVAGAALYLLSAADKKRKTCAHKPVCTAYRAYEYFDGGATLLRRLTECVRGAQRYVYLEYYIISKGDIWGALCSELKSALSRGVEVRLVYDGLGSALAPPKRSLKELERAGAKIKVFNKPSPFPLSSINLRDHRKLAVIDGDAVFLGGVNIADEYANLTSPYGHWKDGGCLLYGRVAHTFADMFMLGFCGERAPLEDSRAAIKRQYGAVAVSDNPFAGGGICEDMIAREIYRARERVHVFTPYLCAGDKLKGALADAAARGVDVKIIVPHVPDKKCAFKVTLAFCGELASRGVKVYRYLPGFLHAKGLVCDGRALLGSYNFDFRSQRLNYECGIWAGAPLSEEVERDFNGTLALCEPIEAVTPRGAGRAARALLCLFAPLV